MTEWVRYFVKKTSFIVLEIISTVDSSAILPKARAEDSWFRLLASALSHSTWWCLLSRGSLHCPIQASIWVHDVIVLRSPFCCKSSLYNKLISISAGATQPGKTMVVLKCENWSSHRRKREREKENISRISQFFFSHFISSSRWGVPGSKPAAAVDWFMTSTAEQEYSTV